MAEQRPKSAVEAQYGFEPGDPEHEDLRLECSEYIQATVDRGIGVVAGYAKLTKADAAVRPMDEEFYVDAIADVLVAAASKGLCIEFVAESALGHALHEIHAL